MKTVVHHSHIQFRLGIDLVCNTSDINQYKYTQIEIVLYLQ